MKGIRGGRYWVALAALALSAAGAAAQQDPQLKRDAPPASAMVCPPVDPGDEPVADSAARVRVERFTDAATQALILGDLAGADEFLGRALEADPRAAEAAYLRGRVAADRNDPEGAAPWFCRYLELEPSGASAPEARRRLEAIAGEGVGRPLYAAFEAGVAAYDAGDLEGAEERFAWLLATRPRVAAAAYNRGVVLARLDRPGPARAELERYLELEPDAPERAAVEELMLALAADGSGPSPAAAFLLGVVPGGGQYYTGRGGFGLAVTALAAGAVATGYLVERTNVLCRDANPDGGCPADAILGQETERPLLVAGVATAAGLALAAAIEAALHARNERRARYEPPLRTNRAHVQIGPRLAVTPPSVQLSLIRLRF